MLVGQIMLGFYHDPTENCRLAARGVDRRHSVVLGGPMAPCRWTVNGKTFPTQRSVEPGRAGSGSASKRRKVFQPMQLHGHTFAVVDGGARKDTGMVRPMQSPDVALDADHPQWVAHCHTHHAESGMMTTLSYRSGGLT